MATTYKIMLVDELDFDMRGVSREETIRRISEDLRKVFPHYEIVADFYQHLVIDVHKTYPYSNEITEVLLKCCDFAYAWADDKVWDKVPLIRSTHQEEL